MPIEEEENEISSAGPSTKATTYLFPDTSTNATVENAKTYISTDNDKDKHIIIHVNEFENNDKENCSNKKSIFQNDSSRTDGYGRNAVTFV